MLFPLMLLAAIPLAISLFKKPVFPFALLPENIGRVSQSDEYGVSLYNSLVKIGRDYVSGTLAYDDAKGQWLYLKPELDEILATFRTVQEAEIRMALNNIRDWFKRNID